MAAIPTGAFEGSAAEAGDFEVLLRASGLSFTFSEDGCRRENVDMEREGFVACELLILRSGE